VGQELLAYSDAYEEAELYFWARDGSGHAEVDYIINFGTQIIPAEVKAGKKGKLRSLKQFILEKNPLISIRISEQPLELNDAILSVPLYLTSGKLGIPQGGPFSPLASNIYLNEIDKMLERA